jgi:hypothetical protein
LDSKDAVVEERHARKVVESQIEAWDSNPRNPSGLETLVVVRNEGVREGYESAIRECGRGYGTPSVKLHDFTLTHTVGEDPRPGKTRDDVPMPLSTCEILEGLRIIDDYFPCGLDLAEEERGVADGC